MCAWEGCSGGANEMLPCACLFKQHARVPLPPQKRATASALAPSPGLTKRQPYACVSGSKFLASSERRNQPTARRGKKLVGILRILLSSNFFRRFHVGSPCSGWKCTCCLGRVFLFSRTLLTTMLSSFTLNKRRIPTLPPPEATTRTEMTTSGKTPRGETFAERPGAVAELQCTVREAQQLHDQNHKPP